jgi:5-methylcytosine-specific restriction endonuclease McrA
MATLSPSLLSDSDLLDETARAAGVERRATADLLHLLAEVDRRRLFLGLGYSSLFTYCTQALRLSEPAAYTRITAARAAARWPTILPRLAAGDVTLTAVTLLATHLTDESHQALLDSVSHKSKREVERLVAGLNPKPDVASVLRRLPAPAAEAPAILPVVEAEALLRSAPEPSTRPTPPPPPRAVVAPLSTDRYLLRVTLSDAAHTDLERIRELLRHSIPTGDPSAIVARALAVQRQHLERTRHGAPRRPRARVRLGSRSSRHVPAAVRREVWHRDEGRCAFIGTDGRCRETGFLEFHHVDPFARGGPTTVENVALRCRAHNVHEAERDFGARSSSHRRGAATSSREFCPDRAEQVGRPALGDPRCGA